MFSMAGGRFLRQRSCLKMDSMAKTTYGDVKSITEYLLWVVCHTTARVASNLIKLFNERANRAVAAGRQKWRYHASLIIIGRCLHSTPEQFTPPAHKWHKEHSLKSDGFSALLADLVTKWLKEPLFISDWDPGYCIHAYVPRSTPCH